MDGETNVRDAAERLATTTRWGYEVWKPIMVRWWAAGHDLEKVVGWVESQPMITPTAVSEGLAVADVLTPQRPRRRPRMDDDRTDDDR